MNNGVQTYCKVCLRTILTWIILVLIPVVQGVGKTQEAQEQQFSTDSTTVQLPATGYAPHPSKPLIQFSQDPPLPVSVWDSKQQRLFTLTFEAHPSLEQLWDNRVGWLIEYDRSGVQQSMHKLIFDSFEPQRMDIQSATGGLVFWDEGMGSVHIISGLSDGTDIPPVLESDLSAGLTRVDRSFPHRNMYDHAAVLTPNQLITYGGYGNWFFKQLLIYLDESTLEWLLIPQQGDPLPPRGARAQLFQYPPQDNQDSDAVSVGDVPLTLIHPLIDEEGNPTTEVSFQRFVNRTWQNEVNIELPTNPQNVTECSESFIASITHKQPGTYRVDPNRETLAVYDHCGGLVFLNPETMTAYVYPTQRDSYSDDYHYSQTFYDRVTDNWIIFHFHLEPLDITDQQIDPEGFSGSNSSQLWTPIPVSIQQITASEIANLTKAGTSILPVSIPTREILMGVLALLVSFVAVYINRRRNLTPFTFIRSDGHIKIQKGLRLINEIHRQDLVLLFTVILRMHPFNGKEHSWTMRQFDEALGYHELSASIRNSKRQEIIDHFNQVMSRLIGRTNVVVLGQYPDPHDKRKKLIILNTKKFPPLITQGFTQKS